MKQLGPLTLSSQAVASGATTPVPGGGAGSMIWSSTTTSVLIWNGSSWVPEAPDKATLASPALTGNPTAPTASVGDNDTSIATTAFVTAAVAAKAPAVQAVTSAATVTPTFSNDIVKVTAQAAALTLANPTGTAVDCWGLVIRVKDNGTARAISFGTQYRAIGITLPTTTVVSKTLYLACIYNTEDTKWDVIAVGQE